MPTRNLTELNRLEDLLKEAGIRYRRVDEEGFISRFDPGRIIGDRHQILVPSEGWDVVCQCGSYGCDEGLLEAMGSRITGNNDVIGYLTAEEVMARRAGEITE